MKTVDYIVAGTVIAMTLGVLVLVGGAAVTSSRPYLDHEFRAIFNIPRPETDVEARVIYATVAGKIADLNKRANILESISCEQSAKRDEAEIVLARAREFDNVSANHYKWLRQEFATAKRNAEDAWNLGVDARALVHKACALAEDTEHFTNAARPAPCHNPKDYSGGDF